MIRYKQLISRLAAVASLPVLLFSGCSTELDPNADYKETMVVYSVLNPSEKIHYAKVTKAFVNTNADAKQIAATTPDSSYYAAGVVNVFLEKLKISGNDNRDTAVAATYPMIRIDTTGKAPGGDFSTARQVLYRTEPGKPGTLDENSVYRVVVKNNRTGEQASGVTPIVNGQKLCIWRISHEQAKDCFNATTTPSVFEPHLQNNVIWFYSTPNATIYTVKMAFHYTETQNGVTEDKMVEWTVKNNFVVEPKTNPTSLDFEKVPVEDNSFYTNVSNLINTSNDNATTERKAKFVTVSVIAGSDALRRNFDASRAYSVFSQVRPEFDNIRNGYGIVGSRNTKIVKGEFSGTKGLAAEKKLVEEFKQLKFKL